LVLYKLKAMLKFILPYNMLRGKFSVGGDGGRVLSAWP
jgi:hypothetical protein